MFALMVASCSTETATRCRDDQIPSVVYLEGGIAPENVKATEGCELWTPFLVSSDLNNGKPVLALSVRAPCDVTATSVGGVVITKHMGLRPSPCGGSLPDPPMLTFP
jgi:hypothetical protein